MINFDINKLDWDSNFWGVNIYDIGKNYDFINFKSNIDLELSTTPFIIQALSPEGNIQYINTLEENGFRFVESKINLVKKVQGETVNLDLNFLREVKREDLVNYKDEFYTLYGQVSRFAFLGKEKVNDFYYKWVSKSIQGNFDDNCIGYYDNDTLAGFITYKIEDQKSTIGLVGVFTDYQGKKISQSLLFYIYNVAVKNDCKEIRISTQGKNTKAINSYIKNGFLVDNIKHWYYYKGGFK